MFQIFIISTALIIFWIISAPNVTRVFKRKITQKDSQDNGPIKIGNEWQVILPTHAAH